MPENSGPSRSEETGDRRLTRNNGLLGTSLPPKRIKAEEKDDEHQIRVNPFWVPLDEIPPEVILDGKAGAVWHFSATLREESARPGVVDWGVMLGSEEALTVMGRMDFLKVLGGMRQAANRQREEDPETETDYPSQEDLAKGIHGLGHPTIAVEFKIHGVTKVGKAALSGEFRYDPALGSGRLNDKSGRYMSKSHRPETEKAPEKIAEWGQVIAKKFSDHLGIPVAFEQLKTLPNPVGGLASTLRPPAVPAAGHASAAARQTRQPRTDAAAPESKRKRR
ncbi:hypothetical protein [Streptomyces sp. NPDC006645]|uniref:hypothetical protein n=1 Tax=unclassified Streptomyces TaxID=2593676 RepID=UPI0033B27ED0